MSDELTTLSRTEAQTLQSFISQIDYWTGQHGEKADVVEIVYYPEDDGFEVSNNEPNNGILKRNRATIFRTEILAWGVQMLKELKGWDNTIKVTKFACVYKDGKFGVSAEVRDTTAIDANDSLAIESPTGSGSIGD
ncbi:hypothetical protein B0181_05050 [Moraxella caviae]|uniref:Uncharacterized protein n=1 Tax=Moraxella caviae TaxID=34060 RepID=A0A1T0A3D4_9GAMM|nr:hypothetical protein [Moraxella caviae]OOR90253.1 hypothetical protein B0181_05050 [Moraxella caviae]STZ14536.1 Uncharacterised protein [Moraxella caviae]VEW12541.1 Uncharacterised protein [Moraxella caviae]